MAYNQAPYDRPPPYVPAGPEFSDIGKAHLPPQQATYAQPLQATPPYHGGGYSQPAPTPYYPPAQGAYSPPQTQATTAQPTTNVIIVNTDAILPGHCARCRVGVLQKSWPTCCGVCWAIWCFPCGLICCCTMSKTRCSNCGVTYSN